MSGTVEIHPGEVVHSMDHLVLDLAGSDGPTAYLTIYSLGLMRDVGQGRVALLRCDTPGGAVDRCFGETVGLAARMQKRLRAIRSEGGSVPTVGGDDAPTQATIRRLPSSGDAEQWLIRSDDQEIVASWSDPEPALWLSAPAPAFHPTRDYVTTMVGYRRAELVVDGTRMTGEPYVHELWQQRLGRPFSSCHAALAETAIDTS